MKLKEEPKTTEVTKVKEERYPQNHKTLTMEQKELQREEWWESANYSDAPGDSER